MQNDTTQDHTKTDADTGIDADIAAGLDLGIEELDEMAAPGFWSWAGGVAGGAVVAGGVVAVAT